MTMAPSAPSAPFLVWPVARREFYQSIAVAMLPTLAWGIILFGWRIIGMFIGISVGVIISHVLLKRLTTRGKKLVFHHSIVAAWVLVALAQPSWPIWIVSISGFLVPAAMWLVGGPGRERFHVAVLFLLLFQFAALPMVGSETLNVGTAILARDRLVMGDIRNQTTVAVYQWPRSFEIRGNDAVAVLLPRDVAMDTLNQLAIQLHERALWNDQGRLDPEARRRAQATIDHALANLPSMEILLLGVAPGRVGAVSLIGLIGGGLYLAYRYILRSRSVAIFLITFVLASALLALSPALASNFKLSNFSAIWRIWATFPAEIVTLVCYSVLNSDAFFAAIIILALPGTEPLTPRGRQVFLVVVALLAAILTRFHYPIPAATLAICLFMPFAARFDQFFAKRSWLNRLSTRE